MYIYTLLLVIHPIHYTLSSLSITSSDWFVGPLRKWVFPKGFASTKSGTIRI